jgi:hypothetical protein
MITFAIPLPVGNANKIILAPIAGATKWKLLRKSEDTFTGHDDSGALLVHEGTEIYFLDTASIANGQAYYYRAYYLIGATWIASATVSVTPACTFVGAMDVMNTLRDRLDSGLRSLLARNIVAHPKGHIPVLLAPPALEDSTFPVVTLHLTSETSSDHFIGDLLGRDVRLDNGDWQEGSGWWQRVQVSIVGWSQNPDERAMLRIAVRDVVLANLEVFAAVGMMQIEFSQQQIEDFASYGAPMYEAMGNLTCTTPVMVTSTVNPIGDVTITQGVTN